MMVYGVAARALPGENVAGDRHLFCEQGGAIVIAVVDGLGHGAGAAFAAEKAIEAMRRSDSPDVSEIMVRCDEQLRGTRGAVVTLVSLDPGTGIMSWIGIGNVEGVVVRAAGTQGTRGREFVLRRSGVVGHYLPDVRPVTLRLNAGDTLVLATDGIRQEFAEAIRGAEAPQGLADRLLRSYGVDTDDALVLAARWSGAERA